MVAEKTTLPFEVSYSEQPSKKSRSLKRVAALIKSESLGDILSTLKELNLEATIYDVKGVSKENVRVASGRGSGTAELTYNTRKIVATVVNSDSLDEVVRKMKKSAAGNKVVVMISPVDDLIMI
jgi:nitrogen regulatory protein PII